MSALIGALRVSLGLDSAAFVSGSKRAASQVDVLGNRMEKAGFAVGRLTRTLVASPRSIGARVGGINSNGT